MDIKIYRAKSMHAALELVRRELGPDASVLQTRQVRGGLLQWLGGSHQIEVVASANVRVPSRFPDRMDPSGRSTPATASVPPPANVTSPSPSRLPPAHEQDYRSKFRDDVKEQLADLQSLVEDLCERSERRVGQELPESLFRLFTDLIDAEVSEELARVLIDRVRSGATAGE